MQTANLSRRLLQRYVSTCVTCSVLIETFRTFCYDPVVKFMDTLWLAGISTENFRIKLDRGIVFGDPGCRFRIFICIKFRADDEPLQTGLLSYHLTLIVCSRRKFDKIRLTIQNHESPSTPSRFCRSSLVFSYTTQLEPVLGRKDRGSCVSARLAKCSERRLERFALYTKY